jgi:amino acid transporter
MNTRQERLMPDTTTATVLDTEFKRGLGLFDSTMVVIGSMIGSGIFIVSADMARTIGARDGCWWRGC